MEKSLPVQAFWPSSNILLKVYTNEKTQIKCLLGIFTKIPHSSNKYLCVYRIPGIVLEAGNIPAKWQTRFLYPHPLPYSRADTHKTTMCNKVQQETHNCDSLYLPQILHYHHPSRNLRVTLTSLLHLHPVSNQRLAL